MTGLRPYHRRGTARRALPFFSLLCLLFAPPDVLAARCGADATAISAVQGTGSRSPLAGQRRVVEGVVTADFNGRDALSGFYLISAEGEQDADPRTSEGLFVHAPEARVRVGHRMRVAGRVKEYHGLTELTAIERLLDCGMAAMPDPAPLDWPLANPEAREGMPVTVGRLRLIEQYQRTHYGTLQLAPRRLFVSTQLKAPGPAAQALAKANQRAQILLDDGSLETYPTPSPAVFESTAGRPLRLGDRNRPFSAILDYRYGAWRLQPLGPVRFDPANERRLPDPVAEGSIRIAAFNVANFFNGNGRGGGFPTARGARSPAEYRAQKAGLAKALAALQADILALAEIENDGYGTDSAIADLTGALGGAWRFVALPDRPGNDEIANGLLYRADRVHLVGQPAALRQGAFAHGNRPPVAAAFRPVGGDGTLVVVANHFKSKRCNGAEGNNADRHDGQGCWVPLRVRAARELVRWVREDPTGTAPAGYILAGDFNSYRREDPMRVLARQEFHNPAPADAYSYVYDGELGTLDYLWLSDNLQPRIVQAGAWNSNADESGRADEPPWGVSDHDPVWVDLQVKR